MVEMMRISNNPLISIVIPSYNQGRFIEDTILSVLNQDYEHLEVIVIDGGSDDNTAVVLKRFADDARVTWISEPDKGPNDAYNKGILRARGELIGIQNSSDTYEKGVFSQVSKEFSADPCLGMVGGTVGEMDEVGNLIVAPSGPYTSRNYMTHEGIVDLNLQTVLQSTFFRKDIAIAIGGADEDLQSNHSYFFLHYILELQRIGANVLSLPCHWGNFRVHRGSHSDSWESKSVPRSVELRLACQRYTRKYKDILSGSQRRLMLRNAYWNELSVRVVQNQQTLSAVPAFWGWFWNLGPCYANHGQLFIKSINYLKIATLSRYIRK